MSPADEGGPPERPDYKVYRSRRSFRKPDLSALRGKSKQKKDQKQPDGGEKKPATPGTEPETSTARKVVKWVAVAAGVWILISILAFAISASIQKSKLADMGDVLGGANPFLAASPQNILVIGTDTRPPGLSAEGEETPPNCLEAASKGEAPPKQCLPYRADTLMVVRAGGGTFRKLSIPRDTLAEVPGQGPQKINSSYATGGAKLTVQTVEGLLGIDVNEVAIIDFVGFRDLIDALGGVEVELDQDVCSVISGGEENGGFTLNLKKGSNSLDGDEALTLSRTRESDCDEDGVPDPGIDDTDRVAFQQAVLEGIKGRMTSPFRLPYNFLKGPIIAWNAPKAMVSSMGALTLPQLVFAAGIGGNDSSTFLKPSATTEAGNLVVSPEDCEKAAKQLMGGPPPRKPNCPQG
ncbi:MAG: LCP family protein [Solirubrobacterales bacterium]|jgi:LCP family protein required for cell wall assembly